MADITLKRKFVVMFHNMSSHVGCAITRIRAAWAFLFLDSRMIFKVIDKFITFKEPFLANAACVLLREITMTPFNMLIISCSWIKILVAKETNKNLVPATVDF